MLNNNLKKYYIIRKYIKDNIIYHVRKGNVVKIYLLCKKINKIITHLEIE